MELYDVKDLPLSSDDEIRSIQEMIIKGEKVPSGKLIKIGRDHTVKKIGEYDLKDDHVYRCISERTLKIYQEYGLVFSDRLNDEYKEYMLDGKLYNNNAGIDWYLGGASLRYDGGDFIIECPCYKEYFMPAYDNGNHMSYNPLVKHFKSSGTANPVPMYLITRIFDLREYKKNMNNEGAEKLIKVYDNLDNNYDNDYKMR